MIRFMIAIGLGTSIALSLFLGMHYMISHHQQGFKKTENIVMSEFVRLKRTTILHTKPHQVPDKPKAKQRPTPPKMQLQQTQVQNISAPDMAIPQLDIPLQSKSFTGSVLKGQKVSVGSTGPMKINSNVMPLVRIPPIYPRRAARRRIQGWVKIEFIISKKGTVEDAKVVAAEPSSIFNRAALRAIKRWKFKAYLVEGVPQEQRAVQTLEFKLEK